MEPPPSPTETSLNTAHPCPECDRYVGSSARNLRRHLGRMHGFGSRNPITGGGVRTGEASAALPSRLDRALDDLITAPDSDAYVPPPFPEANNYYRMTLYRRAAHTFGTVFVDLRLHFLPGLEALNPGQIIDFLYEVFANLVSILSRHSHTEDLMRLVFRSTYLLEPISSAFVCVDEKIVDLLMDKLQRAVQSSKEFSLYSLDHETLIHLIYQPREPVAGGRMNLTPAGRSEFSVLKWLSGKKSVVSPPTSSKKGAPMVCFALALLVCRAKRLAEAGEIFRAATYVKSADARKLATKIHKDCGLPTDVPTDVEGMLAISNHQLFNSFNVKVLDFEGGFVDLLEGKRSSVLRASQDHKNQRQKSDDEEKTANLSDSECEEGWDEEDGMISVRESDSELVGDEGEENELCVLIYGGHAFGVLSRRQFFAERNHCGRCGKIYSTESHRCPRSSCRLCKSAECCSRLDFSDEGVHYGRFSCSTCLKPFRALTCMAVHERRKKCSEREVCRQCGSLVAKGFSGLHPNCGKRFCRVCREFVSRDEAHEFCFIQPESSEPKSEESEVEELAAMDTEALIEEDGKHVPILLCLIRESDAANPVHFEGPECIHLFMEYLYNRKPMNNLTILSHNFKGYDSLHILRKIFDAGIGCKVIFRAHQCLLLRIPAAKVAFKCSLSYFPFPLASFSSCFGLSNAAKSFFPYRFVTWERLEGEGYTGDIPDIEFYDPQWMTVARRVEFEQWYHKKKEKYRLGKAWPLKAKLKKYCELDTRILLQGLVRYRAMAKELMGVDVFVEAVSQSSASFLSFRRMDLRRDSIVVTSDHGIQPRDKFSVASQTWMSYLSHVNRVEIQSALNGREKALPFSNYRCDGYLECLKERLSTHPYLKPGRGVVFEFNGCLVHGCRKCFDPASRCPWTGKLLRQKFGEFLRKKRFILESGLHLIVMWQCQFERMIKEDEDVKEFVHKFGHYSPPVDFRKDLQGGRCEVFATAASVRDEENESLSWLDINSLYPYVQGGKFAFPQGVPEIIRDRKKLEEYDLGSDEFFGAAQVTILPPQNQRIMVLGIKSLSGALIFGACYTCVQKATEFPRCPHSDAERAIPHTLYTSPEIKLALSRGYKIIRIHEVYHFPNRSYSLFQSYMNKWIGVKLSAEGFPAHVKSTAEKESYVKLLNRFHPGLSLCPADFAKNPVKKLVAKLSANSLWGRLSMKLYRDSTELVVKKERFISILKDPNLEVHEVYDVSPKTMMVVTRPKKDLGPIVSNLALLHANFVTSWARVFLFQNMLKLDESQILYCDTDSLLFRRDRKNPKHGDLSTGSFIGEWKDEASAAFGPGSRLIQYVGSSPKNYVVRIRDSSGTEHSLVKAKGFSLSAQTSSVFTPEEIEKACYANNLSARLNVPQLKFIKDKKKAEIKTLEGYKVWKMVQNKRVFSGPPDYDSWPFGALPAKIKRKK